MTPSMTSLPRFNTAADTLRHIEQRAEKAIVHELRLLMQSVLDMRSQLLLGDRTHADSLLLQLDQLHSERSSPATPTETASMVVSSSCELIAETGLQREAATANAGAGLVTDDADNTVHQLHLYDPQGGGVMNVIVAEGFMQALQMFQDQVPCTVDCRIEATWCHGHPIRGELKARTMDGVVVAQILPSEPPSKPGKSPAAGHDLASTPSKAQAFGHVLESELTWPQLEAA